MSTYDYNAAFERAGKILADNDQGDYTVPTKGLYPFQWNWDSCLTALGQRHFNEKRGFTEIETLLAHQWPDGMVPHIVFHKDDDGYFPGPKVWNTKRPTPTSGITQPPVLGLVLRRLYEEARDRDLAAERIRPLLAKAAKWHRWFYEMRDPQGTGLVAILHPWESGRDNSCDWDEALARVPTDGVEPYQRRDTQHVNAAQRPHKSEYDRYLWLVQRFRGLDWDNSKLHDASPFQVVDPGFNAILIRSDEDVAHLAEVLGVEGIAEEARQRVAKARTAFESLWSDKHGQYVCFDRVANKLVESASIGGFLSLIAAVGTPERQRALGAGIRAQREKLAYGIASHDPTDPRFEPKRYWRGPIWIIVNYLIADGLKRCGLHQEATQVISDSLALIEKSGFAEYYDPQTGEGLGGGSFTWTAAMVAELVASRRAA